MERKSCCCPVGCESATKKEPKREEDVKNEAVKNVKKEEEKGAQIGSAKKEEPVKANARCGGGA